MFRLINSIDIKMTKKIVSYIEVIFHIKLIYIYIYKSKEIIQKIQCNKDGTLNLSLRELYHEIYYIFCSER